MKSTLGFIAISGVLLAASGPAMGKSKVGQIRTAMKGITGQFELANNPLHSAKDLQALERFNTALAKASGVKRWNKVQRLERTKDGLSFKAWHARNDGGFYNGVQVEGFWSAKAIKPSTLTITKIADGFPGGGRSQITRTGRLAKIWSGYDLDTRTVELRSPGPLFQ